MPRSDRKRFFEWFDKLRAGLDRGFSDSIGLDLTNSVLPSNDVSMASELEWVGLCLAPYRNELRAFRESAELLDDAFWKGEWSALEGIISKLYADHGSSIWLMAAEIALRQEFEGLESQKAAFREIAKRYPGGVPSFLSFFFSIRNEQRSTFEPFYDDFKDRLSKSNYKDDIKTYLEYKVLGQVAAGFGSFSTILRFEQAQSIYDLYETTLDLLQRAATDTRALDWSVAAIDLLRFMESIGDWRATRLIFCMTGETTPGYSSSSSLGAPSTIKDDSWGIFWQVINSSTDDKFETGATMTERERSVCQQLRSVMLRDQSFEENRTRLLKFGRNFPFIPASITISTLVKLSTLVTKSAPVHFGYAAVHSRIPSLGQALIIRREARAGARAVLRTSYPADQTDVWLGLHGPSHPIELKPDLWAVWDLYILADDPDKSVDHLDALAVRGLTIGQKLLFSNMLVSSLLEAGEWRKALSILAGQIVDSPQVVSVVPVGTLLEGRDWNDLNSVNNKLDLAIGLYAYWKQTEHSLVATYLRFAFEEVLYSLGILLPSEMSNEVLLENPRLLFFLHNVCVPVLMDTSGFFESSEELILERVRILDRIISCTDTVTDDVIADAIDERTAIRAQQMIKSGLRIVDSNRVSVDTGALTRWAARRYRESFFRYLGLRAAGIGTNARFEDIVAIVSASTDRAGEYFTIPENEADTLLLEIILGLREQFLENANYGLEFFLGKRIRHGTVAGHIRGPAEAAGLITERKSQSSPYEPNIHWLSQLSFESDERRQLAMEAFNRFSEAYDHLIANVRDTYLHVRTGVHPQGIFDVIVSAPQFHVISAIIQSDLEFEHFASVCFQSFWALLAPSLESAKMLLSSTTKTKVITLYGELQAAINELADPDEATRAFSVAVQAVSTDVQRELDIVATWFEMTESSSPHQFTLGIAVQVAIESALKSLTTFRPTIDLHVKGDMDTTSTTMLVIWEFIFVVLDNIYRRARVGMSPNLTLSCEMDEEHKLLTLTALNKVGGSVDYDQVNGKLSSIRQRIAADDISAGAAQDRGSGLLKIAAMARQFKSGYLSFSLSEEAQFETKVCFPVYIADGRFTISLPDAE